MRSYLSLHSWSTQSKRMFQISVTSVNILCTDSVQFGACQKRDSQSIAILFSFTTKCTNLFLLDRHQTACGLCLFIFDGRSPRLNSKTPLIMQVYYLAVSTRANKSLSLKKRFCLFAKLMFILSLSLSLFNSFLDFDHFQFSNVKSWKEIKKEKASF